MNTCLSIASGKLSHKVYEDLAIHKLKRENFRLSTPLTDKEAGIFLGKDCHRSLSTKIEVVLAISYNLFLTFDAKLKPCNVMKASSDLTRESLGRAHYHRSGTGSRICTTTDPTRKNGWFVNSFKILSKNNLLYICFVPFAIQCINSGSMENSPKWLFTWKTI